MNTEGAIAKYMATEAGNAAADAAIQAHGGYGYTREYVVEKIKRDVRITTIYEGTSEIMEMTIARDRWQQHLKTRGAYYRDAARRHATALHARSPTVGRRRRRAGARLPGGGPRGVPDRPAHPQPARAVPARRAHRRRGRGAAGAGRRASRRGRRGSRCRRRPTSGSTPTALAAMSRVFAREAAAEGGRRRAPAGSRRPRTRGHAGGSCRRSPLDAIRAAQAGLLADMDPVADVLYDRPSPDSDCTRKDSRP